MKQHASRQHLGFALAWHTHAFRSLSSLFCLVSLFFFFPLRFLFSTPHPPHRRVLMQAALPARRVPCSRLRRPKQGPATLNLTCFPLRPPCLGWPRDNEVKHTPHTNTPNIWMRRLLPALPPGPIRTALPAHELPIFPTDRGPSSRNIDAFRPTHQMLTIPHAGQHKPAEHPISFPPPAIPRFRLGQQLFFLLG